MANNASHRHTVYYTGHVQGVGFRYTAHSIARSHEVTGYVRNLPDGRVELVAEGAPADLDQLLTDIASAMSDHIHHIETHTLPPSNSYPTFEITH